MISVDRLLRILNLLRRSGIDYSLELRRGECLAICFNLVDQPVELEFHAGKVAVHYGARDAHAAIRAAMSPPRAPSAMEPMRQAPEISRAAEALLAERISRLAA